MNFTHRTEKKPAHASPSLEQAVQLLFGDCYTSTHWRRNMQLRPSRAGWFDPTDTVACPSNGRAFVSLWFKGCYTSPLFVGSKVLKMKQNEVVKRERKYNERMFTRRVGTLIVATIYLQLMQNRYMFRSFTVLTVLTFTQILS